MDIQSIRKIIFPAVSSAINELEQGNQKVKLTILRDIFNEAINGALNISHTNNSSIKSIFSGRGRAWAKISVDEDNPVWVKIKEVLTTEMKIADTNSEMFGLTSNMLDLFESSGIAWVRFGSSSKGYTKFHLRLWGSKLDKHIKIYIDNYYVNDKFIQNLEGVPHNLGLESGLLTNDISVKEKVEKEVSKDELDMLGIISIDDILIDENNI
jgi:hypothetical protein